MMADKSMYEPLPLDEADAGPGTDDAPIGLHDDPYLKNASAPDMEQASDPYASQGYPSQDGYIPHSSGPYPTGYPPPAGVPPQGSYPPGYPPAQGYPAGQGGYPPQQGYPPNQQQQMNYPPGNQTTSTTVTRAVYLGPNSTPSGDRLTSHSCEVTCHHCGNRGATFVEHQAGLITWIVCGSVCLVGCWLGCCLIPFCVDDLQDTTHRCRTCHRVVGMHKII